MIEVKNLYKRYDDNYVLNDVSVKFEQGKCNLIIGRSGSGNRPQRVRRQHSQPMVGGRA